MKKKPLFSGKVAFTLYDTYGFPLDLTQSILREKNIEVNIEEFENEMNKQKLMAKQSWTGSGDIKNNKLYYDIKEKIKETKFVGYDKTTTRGKILALIKNNEEVQEVSKGDEFEFFVDETSFYGESGGQVGDTGIAIQINENGVIPLPFSIIEILNVQKPFPHYFLHKAKLESGKLKVGDYINLSINKERRNRIKANHSSAHLLQYALRVILGNNINQRGSYIDENKLRFDFNYNGSIGKENTKKIEDIVNKIIYKNTKVIIKTMTLEDAKQEGAIALFNEKYESNVRVVYIGETNKEEIKEFNNLSNSINNITDNLTLLNNTSLKQYLSIELCGGTHVEKTGDIGLFKIINEESVSSGIRRIEAVTGPIALEYLNKYQSKINDISNLLQINSNEIINKINSLLMENKKLKQQLNSSKNNNNDVQFIEEMFNNIKIAHCTINMNPKDAKIAILNIFNSKYKENSIILSINNYENKATIILCISKNISEKYKANEIIQKLVGNGGGQSWFSMGGVNMNVKIETLIDNLKINIK